jgi:ubiquinone/menaquinone biosynthesis C-methylase UbiE
MSDNQKSLFLREEGDAWFSRNKETITTRSGKPGDDAVLKVISSLNLVPKAALEIGCADGYRLRGLEAMTGAACSGVEPSSDAVAEGLRLSPHHRLKVGTADALDFADEAFDMVIYGFCLMYCDRKDLFKVAMEGDRVLKDGGHVILYDFCTDIPYRNAYSHKPGYYCYKMRYGDLFSWSPLYSVIHHQLLSHPGADDITHMDDRIGITVLRKNVKDAFPDNPYKR